MALHAWCDHVVHVHLHSRDEELSQTCARLIEQRFAEHEVDTMADAGHVEVRSSVDNPLNAGDVAQALLAAQVRALAIFDRDEWSVTEL